MVCDTVNAAIRSGAQAKRPKDAGPVGSVIGNLDSPAVSTRHEPFLPERAVHVACASTGPRPMRPIRPLGPTKTENRV